MSLQKEIDALKKRLMKRAERGIHENFGQKEVRKLEDKYNYFEIMYGTALQRKQAALIRDFDNWCMTYTNLPRAFLTVIGSGNKNYGKRD